MGLLNWIRGLGRRGSNTPPTNSKPAAPQIPPPGADPVATDEDLIAVATGSVWTRRAYRAIYARGRADECAAIVKALGVEP